MQKDYVHESVADFEKTTLEYRTQLSAPGSGIIIPKAMARQQNQELVDGKWIPLNYNVFIYEKYDDNLAELHKKHYTKFNEVIIADIMDKCLIRK